MRAPDRAKLAELVEPFRSRLAKLLAATGDRVWIGSGRRTRAEQVQLRRQHCGSSFYDIWQKPASQCDPPTAIPGRSEHEKGRAADLEGDLALAHRLAAAAGIGFPVEGEDWHAESLGGAAAQGLTGLGIPGAGTIGGALGFGADQLAGAFADLVDPLLGGLARIALTGVLITGGAALVVLGGIRTVGGKRWTVPGL